MKLKKKGRFFGICILLVLCINMIVFRPHAEDPSAFRTITVQSGDTLWEIAQEYLPNGTDIRSFLWELKKINHLETGEVYAYQTLQIPVS